MCGASPCRAIARSRRAVKNRDGPPARCRLDESFREDRCGRCRRVFAICGSCDNGQMYCRPTRSGEVRRASKRRARARHQASPLGRKDHRDRQRAYRARHRHLQASATDQGSRKVDAATKLSMPAQLVAVNSNSVVHSFDDRPRRPWDRIDHVGTHHLVVLVVDDVAMPDITVAVVDAAAWTVVR